MEYPQAAYSKDEKKGLYPDETKETIGVSTFPVADKKDSAARPPKPANKPKKKKASKWILWQLWFNTYRYVLGDFVRIISLPWT